MSTEQNKALVRRFYEEVWNRGNLTVADEIFAEDCVRHDPRPSPVPTGPAGQQAVASMMRTAFPDLHMAVDFLVTEGDMVVARWTAEGTHLGVLAGTAPTGRQVRSSGVNIFRFAGGKVVELWNHRDDLDLMQQLGIVVTPGEETRAT